MASPTHSPGKAVLVGLTLVALSLVLSQPHAQSPVGALQAELLQKADADGRLPVIVQLQSGAVPEHSLAGDAAVELQRQSIAALQDSFLARISGFAPEAVQRYMTIPAMAFVATPELLRELLGDPQVESISENLREKAFLSQSVPLIGASSVHSGGITGAGVTVAILDGGFQTNHPFFGSRIVSEACYSNMGVAGPASMCPNFAGSSTAPGSSNNCTLDDCSHGTHVAGIVAGSGGVAPGASLITINVFTWSPSGSTSFRSDTDLGLERVYALRNSYNIAAVNLSLGGGQFFSSAACDADRPTTWQLFSNLRAVGIAPVVASGNAGYTTSMASPACLSNAVSVGNSTKSDFIAGSSNQASWQTLLATGSDIVSSVPVSSYGSMSGTSMAAPHVAGAWALLKQRTGGAATVPQSINAFRNTGLPIQDPLTGLWYPRIRVDQGLALFPTVSNIADQTIAEDALLSVPFTVSDAQQGADALTFSLYTSNLSLTPTYSVVGTGSSRTLQVQPAANQSGSAYITLVASDGQYDTADGFWLTVSAVNDTPTISSLAPVVLNEDTPSGSLPFTVGDVETPTGSLSVSAVSSNTAVVPNAGLLVGGAGANRTMTVTPAPNQSGSSTITVFVSDGQQSGSTDFLVTVLPINDPPSISAIADQQLVAGAATGALAVTLSDADHPIDTLTFSASSSNPAVVAGAGITLGGSGGNRTVTVQTVAGVTGSSVITLSSSDGTATGTSSFTVHVTHNAPTTFAATADGSLVDFSWQSPAAGGAATGYRLELGTTPGATTATLDGGPATSLSATTIAPGTWFARVRALGAGVVGPPSNEVSFTLTGAPSRPRSLAATVNENDVSFTWTPPAAGSVAGYLIEAGSGPGLSNLATLPLGVSTSFQVTAPNGTYYVRLRAGNALGLSTPSNEVVLTAGPVSAGPPQNLVVDVVGSSVTLSWSPPVSGGTPTSYVLEAGSASTLSNIATLPVAGTTLSVPGVPNGTYFVRVRGVNRAGAGPASEEVSFTVGGPPPELPGAPSGLVATVSGSSVSLSWSAPISGGEPAGYIVYAGSGPGLGNLAALAIGTTPAFATSGVPAGTYYVRVVATNAAGNSGPSNEVRIDVP